MIYEYVCDKCGRAEEVICEVSKKRDEIRCDCGKMMRRDFQSEPKQHVMPVEYKNNKGYTRKMEKLLKKRSKYENRPIVPLDPAYDNHPMFRPRETGLKPKAAFEEKMKGLRKKLRKEREDKKRITLYA